MMDARRRPAAVRATQPKKKPGFSEEAGLLSGLP